MKLHPTSTIAALIWAGIIFALSAVPDLRSGLPSFWDLVLRKLAHAVEFLILAILVHRAFGFRHTIWLTIVLSVLYAASDEWHQTFVPGRVGSLADVGIDALGVLAGALFAARTGKSHLQE